MGISGDLDPSPENGRELPRQPLLPLRRVPRLLLAAVLVCAAIVTAFIAGLAWHAGNAPREKPEIQEFRESVVPPRIAPPAELPRLPTLDDEPAEQRPPLPATVEAVKKEEVELAAEMVKEYPTSSDAVALVATVHERHGNSAEAVKAWERSLQLNPNRADAYDGMGWVALQKGEYEKAAALLRKALQINSAMSDTYNNLAGVLVNLRKPAEAAATLEEAVRRFPKAVQSHFLLGQVYLQLRKFDEAAKSFETAIALEPRFRNPYYGLATAYARLGRQDKSREYMEKFQALEDQHLQLRVEREKSYDDLASARRGAAETHSLAGRILLAHGQVERGEQQWRCAAELDPANVAFRQQLSRLQETKRRTGTGARPDRPQGPMP